MSKNNFYSTISVMEASQRGYYQEKIDFVLDYLKRLNNPEMQILDIACNDGELTSLYKKYGKVWGIDVNKKAISICKKRGLNCLNLDIMKMPGKFNNCFDVVVAGDIIEHIFDTDSFLENIKSVLKKKGKLLLTTPNLASLGRRIMLVFGMNPFVEYSVKLPSVDFNVGHVRYYTYSDLLKQLKFHNFSKIEIIGDKINITSSISIPNFLSKYSPSFCRNLMVSCVKK